jgi:lipopolysaccharide biosynthesis protein
MGALPTPQALHRSNAARLAELARSLGLAGPAYDAVERVRRLAGRRGPRERAAEGALAVPFGADLPGPLPSEPIAVIAHLFHAELAGEIRRYLDAMPVRADLFVSTDSEAKRAAILEAFSGWDRGAIEVRLAANRGRDIAPKLIAFRDVYDRHPIVLHLHGKVSSHDSNLRLWRYFIYETLLGGPEVVASILRAFAADPGLGLVAPQHFYPVRESISWGGNLDLAQGLARRMGIALDPEAPMDFPSGSMFWARSAALKPLLDLCLTPDDFPEESGQQDHTLAHAIERLYVFVCVAAGFGWARVARPDLARPTDPGARRIDGAGDLAAALRSRA